MIVGKHKREKYDDIEYEIESKTNNNKKFKKDKNIKTKKKKNIKLLMKLGMRHISNILI